MLIYETALQLWNLLAAPYYRRGGAKSNPTDLFPTTSLSLAVNKADIVSNSGLLPSLLDHNTHHKHHLKMSERKVLQVSGTLLCLHTV